MKWVDEVDEADVDDEDGEDGGCRVVGGNFDQTCQILPPLVPNLPA